MTTIHITGAGGVISNEVVLITGFLKSLGYEVQVDDDITLEEPITDERYQAAVKKAIEWNASPPKYDTWQCPKFAVLIKATHVPWGG